MNWSDLVDSPAWGLLALAAGLAAVPLAWLGWRLRHADAHARLAALTALALFLTFDLIVVGAFTRLTDSGLGCPDWPGCYGELHPVAAAESIQVAEAALPDGPVTMRKAWIEMIHRYLAMTVGGVILVLALASLWMRRRLPFSVGWPFATLAWVVVQGLFGRWTVTLKLYPAIVALHLLGAMVLLGLLILQLEAYRAARTEGSKRMSLSRPLRRSLPAVMALLLVQIALGAWVSANYAVLVCQGFPQCNGQWWPAMAFDEGFSLLRHLGRSASGGYLPFEALVAIQMTHRLMALVVSVALAWMVVSLWRLGAPTRRWALALAGLLLLQVASGIGNVVLQWPLAGALVHSAGSAALLAVLLTLHCRGGAGVTARAAAEPRTESGLRPAR